MPRRPSPPRLYLRQRSDGRTAWIILDRGRQISTGAGENDRTVAEKALGDYLSRKHTPDFGDHHPNSVLIADALESYQTKHGSQVRRPELIGIAALRLLEFFGERTVGTISPGACADYVAWRIKQRDGRSKSIERCVKPATARRELVVLGAALSWCWREKLIDRLVPISLPPQSSPRERHLTRTEAAALLWGALGWNLKTGERNPFRINRHLARFILIGLYTGTRHDAILRLQWLPNTAGGWIDLDAKMLYRCPREATESGKRQPPLPIPPRLFPHLRRWRGLTARFPIEWNGKPIASQERRAWREARYLAGLDSSVTPHVLRHTCATWLLQAGISIFDVAGVLGCSEEIVRRTYGHHAHDRLHAAVRAFSRG